jgi:DNA-binding NarL/FixJ family response regulator
MKSILIADDNRLLRSCIHQMLDQQSDFEVCGEAENGLQAIEMAERLRPDAVVLDLAMPVMNGLDAAREIRRSVPEARLVLFSGYAEELNDLEMRSAGFAAQVSKTENIATLIGKARDVLSDPAS